MKALFFVVVLLGGLSLQNIAIAQISFTGSYTQNFDSYVSLATLPSGWANGGTGSFQGTGTGSATTGGFYSFNPTGSASERSLGALRSGSASGYYEVTFTNNTGSTLTSVTVSYDFEQYRSANTSGWAVLFNGTSNAALSVAGVASGITTGTPAVTNLSTNITGLSIANGANFTMRWTVTDASGSDNPIAVDNFSMTSCVTPTTYSVTGTGSYCSGGSGVAVGLSNSQTGVTYQLYNGAATVGSAVSGTTGSPISFGSQTTAATYTVVATRTTGGCTANMSGSAVVTINSLPITQTVNGGGAYCAGGAGVLVGLAGSQSGIHYQLYNGASAVGTPVPGTGSAISFGSQTTAATYTVVGTNTVTACAQSMTGSASVSVNPLPSVVVTPSGGSSCVSMTASGASTYIWSPATGLSATTGATVTATPTVTTVYTITGTDGVGCVGATTVMVTPPAIAMTATSPATGSVPQGTTNHVLQVYNLAVTASEAVLTDLTVTTAGSYTTSDLINLKCWYSTSSTFDAGTATLLSTFTTPGAAGSKVFPAFVSQTIPASTTGHLFITGDIAGVATGGNTINIASTPFAGFSICGANLSGTDPIAAGNSQTITAAPCTGTPTGGAADAVPAVICGSGTSVITLSGGAAGSGLTYQWSSNTTNTPPGTNISGATNSVYTTGTVASTTYYWCTTTCSTSSLSSTSSVGTVSVNPVPSSTGATNDGAICVGGTATLSANSLNATAWAWQGPGGFTSSLEHPTASPTVTGTYSLTVASVGDGCDPVTVYTTTVSVNPAPASSGPTNDGPLCTGGSVVLSANSTNATGWSWSGPGGFTSTLENPVATSAAAGIYSLTLSSAGPGCSPATVYTTSVTVFAVPSSTGATNSGPICTGNSVTLNANSTSATSWTWTGSDGFTSSLQNPVTSPTATTTYSLTVSRSGSGCSPATIYTTTVTVNTTPTVVVTPAGGTSGVSMTASGATTYTWLPASGLSASTGATVTATPTVTTTYTVSGTTTGCIGTTTVTVNFPGGSATWNFTAGTGTASASTNVNLPASGCVASIGNTLGTVASPINGTSASSGYTGFTGGNNIGNAAQIGAFNSSSSPYINLLLTPNAGYCLSISGLSFGTRSTGTAPQAFTVSSDVAGFGSSVGSGAIANNSTWSLKTPTITSFTGAPGTAINLRIYGHSGAGSPGSSTINWRLDDIAVTYSVNPSPSLSGATNGGTICAGGTVNLFANAPQNVASYSWAGPNSFTSTEQNPSINLATVAATGTYTVTVGNGSGCSAAYTTSVTVNPTPASTGATNNGPICLGGTVTFFANSTNTNQWTWTGPDGFTSSLQNPTATPTITGTYSLTVNNTVTGCSSAIVYTSTINVNAVPTSSGPANDGPICVGGTVNLSANSTGATAWSWSGPSGASSTLQNPSFTPTATGTYSLTLSSTGSGCNPATVYTTTVTVNPVPSSTGATNGGAICVGGTATLSANSTAATAWSWNGPDGFTSSVQNPTATPTATGTYSLTLSSTGSGCNPATVYTTTVTVNPVPSSTGATNGGAICVGGTATLSANSTAATAWSWNGPDGFTSSVQNPTATPTATGTYSLTLSSTGSGCNPATVYTTTVTVNPVPSSTGATNGGAICVGGTATLSANSTAATAWSWNGPDGFTSSVQNPTATPTATGTYSLTLSSTGSGCNPATVYTTTVTVNPVPSSTGATNGGAICVGGTATLSANSTAATAWSWNGPDGFTSSVQNPTATPTATGTYSLTLSSTGSGCNPATVYTTTVTVNPVPSSTGATNGGAICVGGTATLSANSTAATAWSWNGPDGFTSSVQNPTATPTATGTYSLTLSSTGSGCNPTTVYTTTVTVNPVPSSTGATNGGAICVGGTATLSANSTAATAWSWNGPDGFTSSVQNPTATPTATGTYSLTLSSTGSGCNPATVYTTTVTVNPVPSSTGATNGGAICVGGTATLSANSTAATAWSWNGPDGFTSSIQNPTATPTATGTYSLTLSSTGSGCNPVTVYTTTVTVNPVPSSTGATNGGAICVGGTATLSSNSTAATAWTWNGPDGFTSSVQNPTATPTATGTYSLTLSSTGSGCNPATVYTTTVTVNPVPSSTGATNGGSICVGGTATLSANSTAATAWSWNGPDGFTSSVQNPTATPTATGTYSLTLSSTGSGCNPATVYTTTVTVNPVPSSTGATNGGAICVGGTATLSANSTGATAWSWSGPDGFTSSVQNPTATPTATGTYSLTLSSTGSGCNPATVYTTTVTVNHVPSSTGATNGGAICVGGTATLSANSTAATAWSWNGPDGFTSSVQNPTATPTATGTYSLTLSSIGSGCNPATVYTTTVTVNPLPAAITGSTSVCVGSTTSLINSGGGTWMSTNTAAATIGSSTGIVAGVSSGTTVISYILPTSCFTTTIVTVNATPVVSATSGTAQICAGATTTLSNATSSGVWSSSNTTTATVSAAGIVTGLVAGTSNISYTVTNGFGCTNVAAYIITVNPVPVIVSVTGPTNLCVGASGAFTSSTTGGSWSSSNVAVATIGTSGAVSALTSGTSTITYSVTNAFGCTTEVLTIITVNATPSVAAITGSLNACVGASVTLSSTPTGGTWISSNTAVATISSAGIVNGLTAGTTSITYTVTNAFSCSNATSVVVTLNAVPVPSNISGSLSICTGATTSLAVSGISGGTWSSSNLSVASVGTSGIVTGGSAGTASINYTTFCGTAIRVVTVNQRPAIATIGNDAPVCAGDTVHLSSSASGGTGSLSYNWSGPGSFSATGSGPAISGSATASTGTFTLTVTDINACAATGTNTTLVSVNPLPAAIAGNPNICIGFSTNLSNTVSGGNWTSSNSALASVNSSGVVSGNVLGTAIISYQLPTGCYRTMQVTVNPFPEPIVGDSLIYCIGTSVALTSGTAGGNWTSSNPAIVSANAGTGVVTATGPGVATISYTAGSVCARTVEVTVNPTMNANAGTPVICLGQALSIAILTNDAPGGTWSSSNVAKAIVSPETGVVKGKVAGTVVITYMMNPTCFRTTVVTINPAVSAITGALNVCPGATTTLLNATPGGTWSSNDTTMAKVNPVTGLVTGYTSGTTVVTYLVSTGCYRTANVNMPAAPLSIVGPDTICQGAVATMSSTPAGGTWSSSSASRASVNAGTGVVKGISIGSATITYRISSGCFTTKSVTVNNISASITGTANICPGATTDLAHVITGGTWTSSNIAKATVDPTNGLVTGISGGTAVISYFTSPGCYKTTIQTVYTAPTNISGVATVCEGFQTTLASGPSGGSWSSSTTGIASVATGGLVTAIASGVTTITYQSTAGCYVTRDVTVNSLPAAITGPGVVCMGSAPLFATSSTGGVWSSSNLIKATIDASSGIITPLSSGVTNISYTLPTGCYRKVTTTVSPVPAAIAGIDSVCEGSTTALTVATGGGVWSSSNTVKATINSLGVVTGMSAGTTSISYQLASGCLATRTVSVNALPAVTAGVASACIGDNVTFTASPVGGFWSSSNTSVATINSASGTITGVGAGSSTISYILSSGCFSTAPLAFYAAPPAIVGVNVICEGASTTFTNTASGGVWISADTAVATVGTTGVVVGTGSGVTNITYQVGTGCYVTRSVTVNSVPSPLGGSLVICAGNTTTLSVTPSGGVWSSSNTTRATVDATGIVQGLTAGTAVITYSTGAGTGCFTAAVVTVNALPGVITGTASVCVGNSTSLATTPTGGSWSSSNTGIATIDAMSGVAAGIAAGSANIVYTMPGGCFTSTTLTVNAGPVPNTGGNVICLGQPVAIAVVTNPTTGGTWTSGNTLRAVISPSTGVMVGQSAGTVNITYTIGTGCYSVTQVTVNGAVGAVSGPASICVGTAVALSDTTPSGTWMSSNLTKATTDAGTGMVTGISAGSVIITYYVNSGCYKTRSIAVNPSPAPITGASTIIVGESTTLASSSSGIWTSSDTSVAGVNLSTGVVTGVSLGSATISYRFSSGCYVAHPLAVIAGKQGNVVTDTDSEVMLTVSPNPTSGALSINAPVAGMLTIATLDGRIVERYTIRKAQNSITLPSHLSAGIYMCRFTGENGTSASVKVVYQP